jgi:hypothetical protein
MHAIIVPMVTAGIDENKGIKRTKYKVQIKN